MVCSYSIKPVPCVTHDIVYIYKRFIIIINAFSTKYLNLKSLIRQGSVHRNFSFGHDWFSFFCTRLGLKCWLIHLFHGQQHIHKTVTCLYINTGTNVQRENIHLTLNVLLFVLLRALTLQSKASAAVSWSNSAVFSGNKYLADDLDLPFIKYRLSDNLENSYPINRSSHFHDILAYSKLAEQVSSSYYSTYRSLKIALFTNSSKSRLCIVIHSEKQLGNSKSYESNYNYSTAVIIKTLPAVY